MIICLGWLSNESNNVSSTDSVHHTRHNKNNDQCLKWDNKQSCVTQVDSQKPVIFVRETHLENPLQNPSKLNAILFSC